MAVSRTQGTTYRAVIFDIGGVVMSSPLHAIAAYERQEGLPQGFVNRVVAASGPEGAWARLECGKLGLDEFFHAFDRECQAAGHAISARELMARITAAATPLPSMLESIRRIRAHGLLVAALTNNWVHDRDGVTFLREHFDHVIESCVVGLRKPDPRIYHLACDRLACEPQDAVFLDDIGRNLKAARELGMTTIKVVDPDGAIAELEAVLGFALRTQR